MSQNEYNMLPENERPDEPEEYVHGWCFLNAQRQCTGDCMAFIPPDGSSYEPPCTVLRALARVPEVVAMSSERMNQVGELISSGLNEVTSLLSPNNPFNR